MAFKLVDPRGTLRRPDGPGLTRRLGAVPDHIEIGFLINEVSRQTGPDFTLYTEVIEDALRRRHRRLDIVRDAKPVLSRPAEQALLDKYRQCRGVVTGLAK